MYWAHNPKINYYEHHEEVINNNLSSELFSLKDIQYQKLMKKEIINFVYTVLNINIFQRIFFHSKIKFVFSSDYQILNGLIFGSDSLSKPGIYYDLNLNNNMFIKIKPMYNNIAQVQRKLGFNLDEKYILCQGGFRDVIMRSKEKIDYTKIFRDISKDYKLVLLNFDTGRNMDSKSLFNSKNFDLTIYNCQSFEEQSILINYAVACLFFTEGDFRSHNYLPPFMGKNVYSVASKNTFTIGTTPINFWNEHVFKFGGKIIPIYLEEINDINIRHIVKKIL